MYNTGARVSEVIGVKVKDVAMPPKRGMPMVTLHGKGRKENMSSMGGFLGFTQTIYRQQVA